MKNPEFGHMLAPLKLNTSDQPDQENTNGITVQGQNGAPGHAATDQDMQQFGF